MNKLTVIRYTFLPYFSGYFQEGKWYNKNGRQIKEKFYNGRTCIDSEGKRFGLVTLRKFAQREEVELIDMPF